MCEVCLPGRLQNHLFVRMVLPNSREVTVIHGARRPLLSWSCWKSAREILLPFLKDPLPYLLLSIFLFRVLHHRCSDLLFFTHILLFGFRLDLLHFLVKPDRPRSLTMFHLRNSKESSDCSQLWITYLVQGRIIGFTIDFCLHAHILDDLGLHTPHVPLWFLHLGKRLILWYGAPAGARKQMNLLLDLDVWRSIGFDYWLHIYKNKI